MSYIIYLWRNEKHFKQLCKGNILLLWYLFSYIHYIHTTVWFQTNKADILLHFISGSPSATRHHIRELKSKTRIQQWLIFSIDVVPSLYHIVYSQVARCVLINKGLTMKWVIGVLDNIVDITYNIFQLKTNYDYLRHQADKRMSHDVHIFVRYHCHNLYHILNIS